MSLFCVNDKIMDANFTYPFLVKPFTSCNFGGRLVLTARRLRLIWVASRQGRNQRAEVEMKPIQSYRVCRTAVEVHGEPFTGRAVHAGTGREQGEDGNLAVPFDPVPSREDGGRTSVGEPAFPQLIPPIPVDLSLPPEKRGWQSTWSRQDYLDLVAVRGAVPSARHHVRAILREWRASDLADEAEQVVAELVANAVNATGLVRWVPKTPPVKLWVLAEGGQLMLVVWDATTGVPVLRTPTDQDPAGRGLMIVSELARWGCHAAPEDIGGKLVWARLPNGGQS
jgi:anti-sigma regulatory factor (Ser/Thr protein kinase)